MLDPSQVSRDTPMSQASQVDPSIPVEESNEGNRMRQDTHVSAPLYVFRSNQARQDTSMSGAIPETQDTHMSEPIYVFQANPGSQPTSTSAAIPDLQTGEPSQPRQDTPMSGTIPETQDTHVSEPVYPRRDYRARQTAFMSGAIPDLQTGEPSHARQDTRMRGVVAASGGNGTDDGEHVAKRPRWVGWGREWGWGDRKGKRKADGW